MKERIIHISELTEDPRNARKHNPRNIGMITRSVQEVGAARSGVADENGKLMVGNGTAEALADAGITKVRLIESTGDEWVVVQRTDLTEEQKTSLALYDNRTAELASWNVDELEHLREEGFDLSPMFTESELEALDGSGGGGDDDPAEKPTVLLDQAIQLRPQREYVVIQCDGPDDGGDEQYDRLKKLLNLKLVRRGGYRRGSAFDATSTQRVVKAREVIALLEGMNNEG